jgi:hypothetical protein
MKATAEEEAVAEVAAEADAVDVAAEAPRTTTRSRRTSSKFPE